MDPPPPPPPPPPEVGADDVGLDAPPAGAPPPNEDGWGEYHWTQVAPGTHSFEVEGANYQVLKVKVPDQNKLHTVPGTMFYMSHDLPVGAECAPKCCVRCCCLQESCFQVVFDNTTGADKYVGLTPNFPAKVVGINMKSDLAGGGLFAKPGGYMGHFGDVDVDLQCDCCSRTCCCGGLGCCRQNFSGDGTLFVAAGGTIMHKKLGIGEKIKMDPTSLVAFEHGMNFDVEFAGCCPCCCGGEGCYTTLEGPGEVYMQSMNFQKYQQAVAPPPPPDNGGGGGS